MFAGVAVSAPDKKRVFGSGGQELAEIPGLLAFPPAGELRAEEFGLVFARADDSLVGPQAPAQLQRRRDEPAHVRLSQVATGERRDDLDGAG
jgi:hypothetical protein